MSNNKIIFETKYLDCGCEYVLNDYEIMKLGYCNEHIFEKYRVGDFTFLNSKKDIILQEYFNKITEMKLWDSFTIKKNGKKKRQRRRWRFIQKEFRPLFKYFKKKYKHVRYYEFRRYLKLMKKINKMGWSEFVKKTIDKQMKKKNNIE
jgi:hypothetical protein